MSRYRKIMKKLFTTLFTICICAATSQAQIIYDSTNIVVQSFAGSGISGSNDGYGIHASFYNPSDIAWDGINLFVQDGWLLRVVDSDAGVTTITNNGTCQGPPHHYLFQSAVFVGPKSNSIYWKTAGTIYSVNMNGCAAYEGFISNGVCAFFGENLYFTQQNQIWKMNTDGTSAPIAGTGLVGTNDGPGFMAKFSWPTEITVDSIGNIYVFESGSFLIRKVTPEGDVSTVAGRNGLQYYIDGPRGVAAIDQCEDIEWARDGTLFIAAKTKIRRIYPDGSIKTVAGSSEESQFYDVSSIQVQSDGSIWVADAADFKIKKISQPFEVQVEPSKIQIKQYQGLNISGIPGRNYRVETSIDFTNWTSAATFTLPVTPHLWFDTNSISGERKFYRATLIP